MLQQQNIFMRGSMLFEDFNYQNFNKYILVDSYGKTHEDTIVEESTQNIIEYEAQTPNVKSHKNDITDLTS